MCLFVIGTWKVAIKSIPTRLTKIRLEFLIFHYDEQKMQLDTIPYPKANAILYNYNETKMNETKVWVV